MMRIPSAVHCYTVQWWGYSQHYIVTQFSDENTISSTLLYSYADDTRTVSSTLLHISVMRIQSAVCWYTIQWWGYSQQYVGTQFSDEDTISSTLLHSLLMIQSAVCCYSVFRIFNFQNLYLWWEKWYCIWSNHTLNKIIYVITEFSNVFWDMISCSLVCRWQCFVATCYPYIQGHLVTPSISQSSILAWRWGQQCGLLKHWYLCRSAHSVEIPVGCGCNKQQRETLK